MKIKRIHLIKHILFSAFFIWVVLFIVFSSQPNSLEPQSAGNRAELPPQALEKNTNEDESKDTAAADNNKNILSGEKKFTEDFNYKVSEGDTLYDLAAKYGVTVEQIKAANNLEKDFLSIDQVLLIPVKSKDEVLKISRHEKSSENDAPVAKTAETKAATSKPAAAKPETQVAVKPAVSSRDGGRVCGEMLSWTQVQKIFARGETGTLVDFNTGKSFNIKRKGGTNHADCEPLTANDTKIMKEIYGNWSWQRRAVVLLVDDRKIAASMAGMPHGSETISTNNFSGHFDLHFYGSMTHGSEYTKTRKPIVCKDHQAMVQKAAGK